MENGIKTYIYGLYRTEGEIFYVGKSITPKSRMVTHVDYYGYDINMVILDVFYDIEYFWIDKLKKQNHPIENKQILRCNESHNINDIITIKRKIQYKIKYGDKMYNSLNHLYTSGDTPLSLHYIKSILNNPSHYLYEHYPIEYINQ